MNKSCYLTEDESIDLQAVLDRLEDIVITEQEDL